MFLSSITDCILLFVLWLTNIYPFNQGATAALQSSEKEPATNKLVDEKYSEMYPFVLWVHGIHWQKSYSGRPPSMNDCISGFKDNVYLLISFEDQIYLLRTRIGSWSQKWGASPCELACLIGKQGDSGFSFGFPVFFFCLFLYLCTAKNYLVGLFGKHIDSTYSLRERCIEKEEEKKVLVLPLHIHTLSKN